MSNNDQSFLHEVQKFGKAGGNKIGISDLDLAISEVCDVLNKEALEFYKKEPEENWPKSPLKIYCHDCRNLVPAGIGKTLRGRPRAVCGMCKSKKISSGREAALIKFYHIKKTEEKS
jgi:hypothetical protein